MLDLNIDAGFCVDSVSYEDETDQKPINTADADSVTSTTTTSATNNAAFAAAASDELDSNSSTRGTSVSARDFSILQEKAIQIEDGVNNSVINKRRNELQLFPVGVLPSPTAPDRAKYNWLNLSVPEVCGGGGVELTGIFRAQPPPNNQVLQQPPVKKSRRGPRSRSSQYRGVTFYRRTGRWESHIWDCGKQVYLGGFDTAHLAARAYDRAAIKFRGVDADINFNISDYEEDMQQTMNLTKEEFVQVLRRQSNGGISRGSSKYRGVTLHKRRLLEEQIGQFPEKRAYDKATVVYNLKEVVANFEPCNYQRQIISTSIDGGNGRDLDLNLGISLGSDGPQRNDHTKKLHFPFKSSESPDGKRVKVQTSSASCHGLVMTTNCTPVGACITYSGLSTKTKERAMATSAESIPSLPGLSNWPWKTQGGNGVVNTLPLLSSAASSGFSSPTTPYPHSLVSPTPQFPATAFHIFR